MEKRVWKLGDKEMAYNRVEIVFYSCFGLLFFYFAFILTDRNLILLQIAQSTAILTYAGNLAGLSGKTTFEQLKVNEALFNFEDVSDLFTPSSTFKLEAAEKEKARLAIAAGPLKEWFDRFEAHIAGSKRYGGAVVLYLQTLMFPAVSGSATPSPPPTSMWSQP